MTDMYESMLHQLSFYHRNLSREELLLLYIKERLELSNSAYIKALTDSSAYLARRNELRVLKKMNTYEKQRNKRLVDNDTNRPKSSKKSV